METTKHFEKIDYLFKQIKDLRREIYAEYATVVYLDYFEIDDYARLEVWAENFKAECETYCRVYKDNMNIGKNRKNEIEKEKQKNVA